MFILTEKIYNKANSDHKFGPLLDQDEYETQTNQNINSVDGDDNKNTDDDSTKKNKPMSLENINYVFKCVGRIIINLFLIYLSQFYTLNAMIVKNVARTDIKLFLPLKCSREVGGHFYRSGKYEFLLIFFQIGMFTSKSMLFIAKKIQPIEIYTCSILCILTFFMLDYFLPFCNFYFFFPLVFLLGMLAGGTYVAAFYSILSNKELGLESNYDEIYESIKNRDYSDMNREYGALKRTPEQIYIDSSNMTIEEVVDSMMEVIK